MSSPSNSTPLNVLALCLVFMRAGGLVVGSGHAAVQPLRRALVERCGWIGEDAFAECVTAAQLMPGIFSLNLAAQLGHRLRGWGGSVAALIGIALPPLVVLLVFACFFDDLRQLPGVSDFLRGARPAIVALIVLPCVQMWRQWRVTLTTAWIPVGAAVAIGLLGVSPAIVIGGLVVLGLIYALIMHSNN